MSFIHVTDLTFAYDTNYDTIFENVSFQMDTDWKLGFIGRNGRGKTTFLNLLLGKYEYSGKITADTEFEYFPFVVEDKSAVTLEVAEAVNPAYELWELQKELSKLEVDSKVLYRPFETLSFGEQTKVLLALLFLKENQFLLIDEPTNHLDAKTRLVVSHYLSAKKGFLLVSHDREFLDRCVNHILSINKTNIEVQKGNFTSWYHNKELQDQFEAAENEKLKRDIRRLSDAAKQSKDWADKVEASKIGEKSRVYEKNIDTRSYIGEKSRRMQQRRKNLQHRQESAVLENGKLLKNIETVEALKLMPLTYHTEELLSLEQVSLFYGEQCICKGIDLQVKQGERVSLQGSNGCGKTSILKLIMGEEIACAGEFRKGSGLRISYVSQDTSQLKGNLSEYARRYDIEESIFKALLRKLDFSRVQFEKEMECYSEGQKKKVLLARSLCERAHLYIWDEPLNFIDVFSRIQVEELLLTYQPTLLFVEHDGIFNEKIATKISHMKA